MHVRGTISVAVRRLLDMLGLRRNKNGSDVKQIFLCLTAAAIWRGHRIGWDNIYLCLYRSAELTFRSIFQLNTY